MTRSKTTRSPASHGCADVGREKGFTLIELLVVVVILGVLIAIAIPLYLNYRRGANDAAARSDLRNAVNVLEQCNSDYASYPLTADIVAAGGKITTGTCAGQTINLSAGTTQKYTATGTVVGSSFILVTTNSGGSSKLYCYNSAKGGAIKDVSTGVIKTLADPLATC
jgi:type IV pilus assembly protein PilA